MMTYTIDSESKFIAFTSAKEAKSRPEAERFGSAKEQAKLADQWPAARLVEIWNALPGVVVVRRFTSRKRALWSESGRLFRSWRPKPAHNRPCGPKKGRTHHRATQKEKTPTARDGSKKAYVLALLRREGGATLQDLMSATSWQAHSVRGFLSGALGKKMNLTVESAKREDGVRVYSITG